MKTIGKLEWDDGVLKASSPNLPTLTWTRPADLAEARLNIEPPIESLELNDGADLLDAAFGVIPFVREPYPKIGFGEAVTQPARDAFALFVGTNVFEKADAFRVLRGEPGEFVLCARRYHDVWKAAAFTAKAITLTLRFEDLIDQLPKTAPRYPQYIAEIVRDANAADSATGAIRETLTGVAPDARMTFDLADSGGFTVTFWPVAG